MLIELEVLIVQVLEQNLVCLSIRHQLHRAMMLSATPQCYVHAVTLAAAAVAVSAASTSVRRVSCLI